MDFQAIGSLFNILFINPITNILVGIYQLLLFVHAPYPLGFSIIGLTILIRLVLYPFTSQQIRSAHKMQKVAPHVAAIKEKHKGDAKQQQAETMKLYKEHGINPMAGCLPLLIQLPIIWSLYNVLTHVVNTDPNTLKSINKVLYFPWLHINQADWNVYFFGILLSSTPAKLIASNPLFLLIPLVTGLLQFILSKMMLPHPDDVVKKEKGKDSSKKTAKSDDFQTAFQNQSLFIFPIMIAFFSYNLPLGLSLYWNTFTIFGIIQQYLIVGAGGAHPWFKKVNLHGRKN
ncbi:MAG TPA: YidC/Oxa1 family membrane protein insertase [Candidatus Levybacteria bacterium]|nr:YidC/Oxa1 family membrane protein insertase [Candidatus Levybacteria bacterium]